MRNSQGLRTRSRSVQKNYNEYSERFKWNIVLPQEVVDALDNCIKSNPPSFKHSFRKEIALYLLSQISSASAKLKDHYYPGGYVNLNSTILKRKCSNYMQYFDYFEKNKIVEINRKYSSGKFSKGIGIIIMS